MSWHGHLCTPISSARRCESAPHALKVTALLLSSPCLLATLLNDCVHLSQQHDTHHCCVPPPGLTTVPAPGHRIADDTPMQLQTSGTGTAQSVSTDHCECSSWLAEPVLTPHGHLHPHIAQQTRAIVLLSRLTVDPVYWLGCLLTDFSDALGISSHSGRKAGWIRRCQYNDCPTLPIITRHKRDSE